MKKSASHARVPRRARDDTGTEGKQVADDSSSESTSSSSSSDEEGNR